MSKTVAPPLQLDAAFFERLFEGAGLPVLACDRSGRVVAWNSLAERLFRSRGCAAEDVRVRDVLPPEHRADFDACFRSVVERHQPTELRTRIAGPDGEVVEYAAWLTPIFAPPGQAPAAGGEGRGDLECVCVWFHDITARLQARRGLRKRERLTTLGALAGAVAHHYNNLLCSIATSLEFALNMNTVTAMRRVLRRTADAVARATQLTQQLLAFAQADHRAGDLADLTEVVLQYFDRHEAELRDRGVRLELRWSHIPFVPVPRDQFAVVLDNLVRNAVEAMPQGGVLTVGLQRRDENAVTLTIADTGPGIPPEHMERLFEPFFTTRGALGAGQTRQAGMGLAVVHGLVSEMRGTISAANKPEGGACFEIALPLDPAR